METKHSLMKLLVGRREIYWDRQQELCELTFIAVLQKLLCVRYSFCGGSLPHKKNLFWTIPFPLRLAQTNNNHERIIMKDGRWVPNKQETLLGT
jgi:hypothetical protein